METIEYKQLKFWKNQIVEENLEEMKGRLNQGDLSPETIYAAGMKQGMQDLVGVLILHKLIEIQY